MPAPHRFLAALLLAAGLLAGCLPATVTDGQPTPTPSPTPVPTRTPAPSIGESAEPSASVSASAEAIPDPAVLDLTATTCPGGAVLEWTPSRSANFHHYTALRSPEGEIAPNYPPIAPAVDWGETYATDPFVTSAVDASILPSSTTWNYRVMAYDILNGVVGASPVRQARIDPVRELGQLEVTDLGDGRTRVAWEAYDGPAACFSAYRVRFGIGTAPREVLSVISNPTTTSLETDAFNAGTTYQLRVEAVRVTTLGEIVVARCETVFYAVP